MLAFEETPWINSMFALDQLCDNEDRSHSIAEEAVKKKEAWLALKNLKNNRRDSCIIQVSLLRVWTKYLSILVIGNTIKHIIFIKI